MSCKIYSQGKGCIQDYAQSPQGWRADQGDDGSEAGHHPKVLKLLPVSFAQDMLDQAMNQR